MTDSAYYFARISDNSFQPTEHVGGGWNPKEQHIAPAMGLLAHLVEKDRDQRRSDGLVLARVSYDILGVLPLEPVDVEIRVIRPGKTIELVEATLSHGGRPALVLRAWLLQNTQTDSLAGSPIELLPDVAEMEPWNPADVWQGGFVKTVFVRRQLLGVGRALCWVHTPVVLLEDEPTSDAVRMLSLIDLANGLAPRVSSDVATFLNVDLSASIFRQPIGNMVGLDTTVSFGPNGVGLTETVIYDQLGAVGTSSQTLTVRPHLST